MIERLFDKMIVEQKDCCINEKFLNSTTHQLILSAPHLLSIKSKGFIVLDFGYEVCGKVHILFSSTNATDNKIRLRMGESVAETNAELGENGAGNYHSIRDCEMPVVPSADATSSETGFRFVRIDVLGDKEVTISNIYAENSIYRQENECYFRTDDEEVNKIYSVAKRTIALCIQNEHIWDGVKRDRAVWQGDFHPELLAITSTFGGIAEIENVLNQVEYYVHNQEWVNCIPAYSAWWLVCLNEYYRYSAKREYVKGKIDYIYAILSEFDKIIKPDGTIDYKDSNLVIYLDNDYFFDWPTNYTKDSEYGFIALLTYAFNETKKLLNALALDDALVCELIRRLNKHGVLDSDFMQVEAFQLLSGRKQHLDKERLLGENSKGMSSFMSYYILSTMNQCGFNDEIMPFIKEFFGGMIRLGATTFWEDFDIEWLKDNPQTLLDIPNAECKNIHRDYGKYCYKGLRHSLCHGWSAGVIAFFTKVILGVEAVVPGYSKVRITPNLLGLSMAEGTIPTPFGEIYVKHELKNGKLESEIKLPKGVVRVDENDIY